MKTKNPYYPPNDCNHNLSVKNQNLSQKVSYPFYLHIPLILPGVSWLGQHSL